VTSPARRPWYRKKRWAAAVAAWLVLIYPLSLGPAKYLLFRDFTPALPFASIFRAVYAPLEALVRGTRLEPELDRYEGWWARLAAVHDGRDEPPLLIPPYPRPDLPE